MRKYRVLRYIDTEDGTLQIIGDVRANSAEVAERNAIEEHRTENGRYVAVPLRNWSENDAAAKVVIELTPVAIAGVEEDEDPEEQESEAEVEAEVEAEAEEPEVEFGPATEEELTEIFGTTSGTAQGKSS